MTPLPRSGNKIGDRCSLPTRVTDRPLLQKDYPIAPCAASHFKSAVHLVPPTTFLADSAKRNLGFLSPTLRCWKHISYWSTVTIDSEGSHPVSGKPTVKPISFRISEEAWQTDQLPLLALRVAGKSFCAEAHR